MTDLRRMVPPLSVWCLGAALFWALQPEGNVPKEIEKAVTVSQPQQANTDPKQAAFILPEAQSYDGQLNLVAKRPLFSETRRLPSPDPAEDPDEAAEDNLLFENDILAEEPPPRPAPPALVFKGFVRNGDAMQALIGGADSPEQWVSEGDVLSEWRVQAISALSVRLERNGFEHIVEFSQ